MTAAVIQPLSVDIDDEIQARVRRLADARGYSPDKIVADAITQYVTREEQREVFRQDTLRAWDEYQRTGLHLTAEEADEWLSKLAHGQDIELPECHV